MDQVAVLMELKVNLGSPWEKLAQRLSLTKQKVLDLVGLLDLPEEIKDDIRHKKLTEKHGRALRQLLDQAEVLREVVNFMKEKKLTGDQSLELVRKIKSEPGFTIEELYKNCFSENKIKKTVIKNPLEAVVVSSEKLTKAINSLVIKQIDRSESNTLKSKLLAVKDLIEKLLNKL